MTDSISNRQRKKLFAANVTAFAVIFLLLGGIILQLLNQTAYRETDLMLKNSTINSRMVQLEIERYQQGDPFLNAQIPPRQADSLPEGDRFNTQVILWSASGEVLNKETIGGRFNQIEGIKLDTTHLDTIQNIDLGQDGQETPLTFRSITKKATNQGEVAYVQVLENTNQISSSLRTFQTIMILCMIVFWLGSIGVSYYLSKLNMRPILASWRRQREFVENASHELRTPLTIIQNSLEHLFTKPNHTIIDESESIAQALSETRRLTGLTSDLLTLARNDSSQDTLTKQELRTKGFIAELVKPFQEMATIDQKEFLLDNQADINVLADPKKLHQVLVILLDNALKYTSTHDQIIVTSTNTNKDWVIHVKNTGPSISDEDKKRIFDRFYREDQARSKETGGYGLGLAIAKQLIEQHKGQLTVADHQPLGVDFKIQLPIK
ncbi:MULTISPECIES: sensor histidine kinase [Enterococcus]|uniref:histidine kinase n=1 Tax=Candidatus Enterococcus mangumiae TaxID=2230878 RepID=A0ABZ2SZJ6_9ENTE|nr:MULTISPECIES: HAMP domain-containing sensor histidine kinase [unclassified Enterococcus]MBO0489032.1 HAMP domain-containing histidine kinase [Enterococcus sp. DIV1094]MBO1299161.1 HAMP domain-containing histidine kinase [Enterococcus sp. DIV1271a]